MNLSALYVCLLVAVAVVTSQEETEELEKTLSGPKRPAFHEPTYPAGDVYFVETFTDADKVWKRLVLIVCCVWYHIGR